MKTTTPSSRGTKRSRENIIPGTPTFGRRLLATAVEKTLSNATKRNNHSFIKSINHSSGLQQGLSFSFPSFSAKSLTWQPIRPKREMVVVLKNPENDTIIIIFRH